MRRKIIVLILSAVLTVNPVYASVIGTEITGWSHIIAKETYLYKNEFISDQSGVGRQTEYYAKYTPNADVLPTVITGSSVWGLRNIKNAEEYMRNRGMVPLIGINASFFSFSTGVPMGVVISEGEIKSKDTEEYQTIGFNRDGTAFIAPLMIKTMLRSENAEFEISHINKYNQDMTPIVNLYTDSFDDDNHNDVPSMTVILGSIDGKLSVGGSLNAVVEEKFNYTGALKIPKGKMLLTLNENSDFMLYQQFSMLRVGDSVTIESVCRSGDERWMYADSAMGSVGERLLENGRVAGSFETGTAPRTAVGITGSGELIFYVIDGRQKGYSYGARLEALAERLKELGCVDAINLDGGGSTAISGIYPGCSNSDIINSPSEKTLRNCSNYIFLKNAKEPTGELGGIYLYPFGQNYLSGCTEEIYATATDTEFYAMDMPDDVEITANGGGSSFDSEEMILTARGTGDVVLTAKSGDVTTETVYHSYETPTEIGVMDQAGRELTEISVSGGETASLTFEAWYNGMKLKSVPECFSVTVSENVGTVNGTEFTASYAGGSGILTVSAGEYTKQIPVEIRGSSVFSDIIDHWAREKIIYVYEKGIISGYNEIYGLLFKPSNNITREEFAVIMCRFLGKSGAEGSSCKTDFTDADSISAWARPYVFEMVDTGMIFGKDTGEGIAFAPKDALTRCEAITILSRIFDTGEEKEYTYADGDSIPSWAKHAVNIMTAAGYISGYEDNTIRPLENVKRSEAVTMIYNILTK